MEHNQRKNHYHYDDNNFSDNSNRQQNYGNNDNRKDYNSSDGSSQGNYNDEFRQGYNNNRDGYRSQMSSNSNIQNDGNRYRPESNHYRSQEHQNYQSGEGYNSNSSRPGEGRNYQSNNNYSQRRNDDQFERRNDDSRRLSDNDYNAYWNNDRNQRSRQYESNQYRYNNNNNNDRNWWNRTSDEVSSWFGDDDAKRRRNMDQSQGEHSGKGPKNYKRSSEKIQDDINERLSQDAYLDASEIEVEVSNNEITLTGTIDSKEAKRRAEDIADKISGVTHVQNNLRIVNNSGTSDTPKNQGDAHSKSNTNTTKNITSSLAKTNKEHLHN